MKKRAEYFLGSVLNSYSQVFFSDRPLAGLFLLLATFAQPVVGLSGLTASAVATGLALLCDFDRRMIGNGTFTFNSMLSGLAMAVFFQPSGMFFPALILVSLLAFFISTASASIGARLQLPFFSIPFVITMWVVLLASPALSTSTLEPRMAGAAGLPPQCFVTFYGCPLIITMYFKTLSAIFFQSNFYSGFLIALALLLHSRISFVLSLIAFTVVYFLHPVLNFSVSPPLSFVAFNSILVALALPGYYMVPGFRSYVLTILAIFLVMIFCMAVPGVLHGRLPAFSLPFSLCVLLLIAGLKQRETTESMPAVYIQQYSPEKHLSSYRLYQLRFKDHRIYKMNLPFFGEWSLTQGHNGNITHKEAYSQAFDFSVCDEHQKTFRLPGKKTEDFYCFGLPVLAPADGEVAEIVDGVDDNAIGDNNLEQNWGNTVIIKHAEGLFSKMSHLKKGSILVKEGNNVKRGTRIASCGNSGRSPEPHLHFQFQGAAQLGTPTLWYPFSHYLVKKQDEFIYKASGIPAEGEVLLPIAINEQLKKAFDFALDSTYKFAGKIKNKELVENWKTGSDLNGFFLEELKGGSKAYFIKDSQAIEFTMFTGSRRSLLFILFQSAQSIPFTDNEKVSVNTFSGSETLPFIRKLRLELHAPLFQGPLPRYSAKIKNSGSSLLVHSKIEDGNFEKKFEIEINNSAIQRITYYNKNLCLELKNISA